MGKQPHADLAILLNQAFAALKDELHAEMARAGFSDLGSSFGYVFRLLEEGPRNLSQIAAALHITPQGTLKIVNAMLEKGYLQRSGDAEDARVKWLALTGRALEAMAVAAAFHRRSEQRLVRQLGAERVAAARAVLELVAGSAGPARPL
ncbi:MAG: MarR family winged helix-turn-helix transcriptional regulator [Telluria sp.]